MSLFHLLYNAANRALSPFGLSVARVEKQPWFRPKIVTTRIGRFSIRIPTINPLSTLYSKTPGYTAHLGVLTALLKKKYPNLAVVDVGANVGDTACIIKSAADVPLLCIEGDDFTFSFLEQNIRQFQSTTAHKLFLGEKTETLEVNVKKGGWNTTLVPEKNGLSKKINIVSLDDFLAIQPDSSAVKLLKIDTEGFDCAIIRGARDFIRQVQPVITFEYNRENMDAIGEPGLDTLFLLAELGYSRIAFHDALGRFLCLTTLANRSLIRDLHNFADGKGGSIYYYDITAFHETDDDIALAFAGREQNT